MLSNRRGRTCEPFTVVLETLEGGLGGVQGVEASAHSQHRHRTAACTPPRLVVCIPVCSVFVYMCLCTCMRTVGVGGCD